MNILIHLSRRMLMAAELERGQNLTAMVRITVPVSSCSGPRGSAKKHRVVTASLRAKSRSRDIAFR